MDPSRGQHQEMPIPSMENMLVGSKGQQKERKARPQPEQALKCPRCDSINTKFCYYNNYSLSQPRYFCKSCRRYWTKGGTLRNVPVGGGCRKNKRFSSSSKRISRDQTLTPPNTNPPLTGHHLPPLSFDTNDLNLAFARLQKQSSGQLGFDDDHELSINAHCDILGNPGVNSFGSAANPAFPDALRSSFLGNQNNFQNFYYGFAPSQLLFCFFVATFPFAAAVLFFCSFFFCLSPCCLFFSLLSVACWLLVLGSAVVAGCFAAPCCCLMLPLCSSLLLFGAASFLLPTASFFFAWAAIHSLLFFSALSRAAFPSPAVSCCLFSSCLLVLLLLLADCLLLTRIASFLLLFIFYSLLVSCHPFLLLFAAGLHSA